MDKAPLKIIITAKNLNFKRGLANGVVANREKNPDKRNWVKETAKLVVAFRIITKAINEGIVTTFVNRKPIRVMANKVGPIKPR